jgi:hypothetical protein
MADVQEPNGDPADVALSYMSHELNEAVTDPLGTGWWNSATGQESADNCNFSGPFDPGAGSNPNAFAPVLGGSAGTGTLFDQLIDHHRYYTQAQWSNGNADCVLKPTASALSATFSAPAQAAAGTAASFDPATSLSAAGYSSTTWSFGDGTSAFATAGPATTTHAFATPGSYTVTLTLVDPYGNAASASRSIVVEPASVSTAPSPASPRIGIVPHRPVAGVAAILTAVPAASIAAPSASLRWQLGDGSTATGTRVRHVYARPGRYGVKLTVTSDAGTHEQATMSLRVQPASIAATTIKRDGRHRALRVRVTGPGKLTVAGRRLRARRPRTFALPLPLSTSQRRALRLGQRLAVRVSLRFERAGAKPQRRRFTFTLRG